MARGSILANVSVRYYMYSVMIVFLGSAVVSTGDMTKVSMVMAATILINGLLFLCFSLYDGLGRRWIIMNHPVAATTFFVSAIACFLIVVSCLYGFEMANNPSPEAYYSIVVYTSLSMVLYALSTWMLYHLQEELISAWG